MTHIIGKPPAPKGGATFGDARRHDVFDALDPEDPGDPGDSEAYVRWVKSSATTAYQLTAPKAGAGIRFSPDWRIVPLDITPRDPEPDPAVTTYVGLEHGGYYRNVDQSYDCEALMTRTGRGTVRVDDGMVGPLPPESLPVRRVPASVVVHEEPGAKVRVNPEHGEIEVMTFNGWQPVGTSIEHIVQQGAALLAQETASPDSGEPKCSECKGRGYHHRGDGLDEECETCTFHDGPPEPAEDRSKPVVDQERRTYSFPMAKPAPEWRLHKHLPGWYSTCRNGYVVGPKHATEADAIAYTHTDEAQREYDAQQAGKGGE